MINLADLGLAPEQSAATLTDAVALPSLNDPANRSGLVRGSLRARVTYEVWSGRPVTIVDSPPGAGKSTLVVDLVADLLERSDLQIVIAVPTRRGGVDLAGRLAERLGDASDDDANIPRVVASLRGQVLPKGVFTNAGRAKRHVTIRTVASCKTGAPKCDLLIIDEAYQTKFAEVACAAEVADQLLMVGDPGQIGPVVTVDTSTWSRMKAAPHMRAPEVFAQRPDALVLRMDATYRVGQATVDAIRPLYGFDFVSKRPERYLTNSRGTVAPELASVRIDTPTDGISDVGPMKAVARVAAGLLGRTVTTLTDGENGPVSETVTLTPEDVAIVVAHNVQSSGIEAVLKSMGIRGVMVGTADKMQGGQWLAVVALDPVVGNDNVGSHQVHPGRLCVMASRHQAHMVWVHDGTWDEKLRGAIEEHPQQAKKGIAVRRALVANESYYADLAADLAGAAV